MVQSLWRTFLTVSQWLNIHLLYDLVIALVSYQKDILIQRHIHEWSLEHNSLTAPNWKQPECPLTGLVQFSRSVMSNSENPWTAARQASPSITNSWSLLKLMSIELVMLSNDLILHHPLLLPPSIFPSIRVFSGESVLRIRRPKYWSFSFNISPSNEYSGLISFRIDWFDLLSVQGTLKSLLQHHSSKASIVLHLVFFMVQFSHPFLTTGKTIALTRWIFVGKVMSPLFNMLSGLVIAFLPRSKHILISWLQWFWSPRKYSVTVSIVFPSVCREVMESEAMILVFKCSVLSQHLHCPY